jgi:Family of unknown function (DUF6680)
MVGPVVEALRLSDWVIAGCTLLGPVLAVQAQKWVEGFREKKARRLTIFRTLMATRALNLSPAHVEALNAVPIDFYHDKQVMDAWEEYFMHLTTAPADNPSWGPRRIDLFVKLLVLIGSRVGYQFNVAQMNRIYFPNAHGELDADQDFVRKSVVALFKGEKSLPIEIIGAPGATSLQTILAEKLVKAYNEDGSLKVSVVSGSLGKAAGRPHHTLNELPWQAHRFHIARTNPPPVIVLNCSTLTAIAAHRLRLARSVLRAGVEGRRPGRRRHGRPREWR